MLLVDAAQRTVHQAQIEWNEVSIETSSTVGNGSGSLDEEHVNDEHVSADDNPGSSVQEDEIIAEISDAALNAPSAHSDQELMAPVAADHRDVPPHGARRSLWGSLRQSKLLRIM